METATFLVQANNNNQQTIACSITDQLLKNLPVSVIFCYKKGIDNNLLIDSLKEVLSNFPLFAGTLININQILHIDCNNQGVHFSITKENGTLDQIIKELPTIQKKRLINTINPKKVISDQSPILTIKLTNFACGGMILGVCWHHSIGDMHTFMYLMKAWSNTLNKKEYVLPLIVKERDNYLQENLEKNSNIMPGVRYLNTRELFKLFSYFLLSARNKLSLQFYFSQNELNNMKKEFLERNQKKLSVNDVLCSHVFSIISDLDSYNTKRTLAILVDYRVRTNLPQNLLGNFISSIKILTDQNINCFQLATELRESVDNFQERHMDIFSTQEYIEKNGGIKKIDKFLKTSIDPINRTLLISNWTKLGVYDIIFENSKPFYFTPFGDYPFPWLSSVCEGFSNDGLLYSVILPSKLAKKLMQENNIQRIHKYRDQSEVMPTLVEQLEWLF
ncbi:acyltransferase [Crocosphaera sp. XPORK-15E]|uniref:acyltransferase n=1 Tax=Crocosphaera sp. XPORK-15E TaxID=3110247 RepID=UPI002B1FDB3A|nr:acyltransferase [Crocosphaera sp. XPORK-15E]MEA5534979.1 acyltransferase [Crocosphaera sp. XPORK-15E]